MAARAWTEDGGSLPDCTGKWDFEIRVFKAEDRRIIAGILAENGYDVGYHKRKRTKTGKSVDYYVHGTDTGKNTGVADEPE